MAIDTIYAGARQYKVTTATAQVPGFPYLELGPAGTTSGVSTFMVQFNPGEDFAGDFVVMGRTMGIAADAADVPFVPIPYRVGSLNNIAQVVNGVGWPWSLDPISTAALIQIPANGLSVVLMNGLTAGSMQLTMWDLSGGSAV